MSSSMLLSQTLFCPHHLDIAFYTHTNYFKFLTASQNSRENMGHEQGHNERVKTTRSLKVKINKICKMPWGNVISLSHRRQKITMRNLNDVLENVNCIRNGALDFYRNWLHISVIKMKHSETVSDWTLHRPRRKLQLNISCYVFNLWNDTWSILKKEIKWKFAFRTPSVPRVSKLGTKIYLHTHLVKTVGNDVDVTFRGF